ncbi:MAG: TolC family protein [Planctomycetes bacterium]|nr:TolC family protein [Planctomycetota bacterium]
MAGRLLIFLVPLAVLTLAGCSADWHTRDADREVYGIVAEKEADALGEVRSFTIRPRPDPAEVLDEARAAASEAPPADPSPQTAEPPAAPNPGNAPDAAPDAAATPADSPAPAGGPAAADAGATAKAEQILEQPVAGLEDVIPAELPPPVPQAGPDAIRLTLADALRVAVRTSREYQDRKETVYLAALTLTFERYLFRPQPFATGTVDFANDFGGNGRTRSWDPAAEIGVSQQLADGAIVAGSLGVAALKYLNKELGDTVDSALSFSLSQPLWRGAGRKIVQENLLQAERNAIYAVRSFARFEKTFAVDVASEYLRVLQQRDAVLNAWNNYQSLREGRMQSEWLAKAERLAEFEVDQARQSEFAAYNRWIVERETYTNDLDALKLTLGVPVTTEIALDPAELERLHQAGVTDPGVPLDDATGTALATRLDLANTRDGVDDARRKVAVAEDGLKGDVDLVASIGYASRTDRPQSARIALARGDYLVGFDIDLPVDRLSERNALRRTQISEQAAQRALEEDRDNVILAVRQAYRRLEQTRESYDIQKRSLALAERRVESTRLLLQAERAKQRDVLEAERDLLTAQNALTGALVAHTVARLQFARDLGTLRIDEKGQIHGWILTSGDR